MSNKVEQLLKAAEAVIIQQGIAKLTIDAVAAEAGMSKGGLLHHFRTKDNLIEALVKRSAEQWRKSYWDAYERTSEGPGRMTRGLLDHCLADPDKWADELRSVSSAIFAALAQDPRLLGPIQEIHTELHNILIQDGLPPGVSEAVFSAINGLWLSWVLGLAPLDQSRIARVRLALVDMVATALESSVEGHKA